MAGPVFNYTVRCQQCGAQEPRPPAIYLNRTAMDEWIKYHRSTCTGTHAAFCWCDGCQGRIAHPEGGHA
jgi:hypothetical protein